MQNSSNSSINLISDTNLQENASVYEIHSNKNVYISVYNPKGIYIIVASNNIDKTKNMVRSIKLNDSYYNSTVNYYNNILDTNSSGNLSSVMG